MGTYAASSESAPSQDQPPGNNDCGEEHDKLFADLEALSEKQIEVGLAAGVWNDQVRPLIQHYLYDLKLTRVEAAADQLDEMQKATQLAVEKAVKAETRAIAAFIVAGGAMLAAMGAAFIAFLALRRYGFQPPW
jgi:CHASE3 domain sensor protein